MNRLGVAGALWLVAATFGIATTLIFRTDPVQWVLTIVVGLISGVLGLGLIARPKALVVSASSGIAVAWIVLYAVLAVQQSGELAAWTTDVALIGIGTAAGLAAYREAARAKVRGTIS